MPGKSCAVATSKRTRSATPASAARLAGPLDRRPRGSRSRRTSSSGYACAMQDRRGAVAAADVGDPRARPGAWPPRRRAPGSRRRRGWRRSPGGRTARCPRTGRGRARASPTPGAGAERARRSARLGLERRRGDLEPPGTNAGLSSSASANACSAARRKRSLVGVVRRRSRRRPGARATRGRSARAVPVRPASSAGVLGTGVGQRLVEAELVADHDRSRRGRRRRGRRRPGP